MTVTGCDLRWCDPKKGIFAKEPAAESPSAPISREKLKEWCCPFAEMMEEWFRAVRPGDTWSESPQILALKAMADPERARNRDLRYPRLGGARDNQFVDFKKDCPVPAGPLATKSGGGRGGVPRNAAPAGPRQVAPPRAVVAKSKELEG